VSVVMSALWCQTVYNNQGAYGSWKVLEFKIQIFQAWNVMESGLGLGKSCKFNQIVAKFVTHVHQNPSGSQALPKPTWGA